MSTAGNTHDETASKEVPTPSDGAVTAVSTPPSPSSGTDARRALWSWRRLGVALGHLVLFAILGGGYALAPTVVRALQTISTDDA